MNAHDSESDRKEIVERVQAGESPKDICERTNIAQSTVYRWMKENCSLRSEKYDYTPEAMTPLSAVLLSKST